MEAEIRAFGKIEALFRRVFGDWQDWPEDLKDAWDVMVDVLEFALEARRLGATPRIACVVYEESENEQKNCFHYELTEPERKVFVALWRWWAKDALIDPDELFEFLPEAKIYL